MRTYLVLFTAALALTACAKKASAPAASPAADPATNPAPSASGSAPAASFRAETLGLELVGPSEKDPAVPGKATFQGGLAALDPAFLSGEVILRNTLSLASVNPGPFFAWPQGEGSSRIDVAFYAVRMQGTDNRLGGEPHYEVATYDREAKRFFIPMKDALSRALRDLGPADEQILMIRLQYADRGIAEFTLRFRVVGPLVAVQKVNDEQLAPNIAGESFLRSGSMVPLRRVTFQNPTLRRVALWLKPIREDLVFIGRFHDWHSSGHEGEPVLRLLNWNSRMQMSQLSVIQRAERRELPYRGAGSGWSVIHFAPGEQVVVEWVAVSLGCGPTRGDIVGVSAEGNWQMDTWVTDDTHPATPEEFQNLPSTLSLSTGPIGDTVRIRTGDWDGNVFGGNECR